LRVERFIQTWGTVIVVDATSPALDEITLNAAIDKVAHFFHHVEDLFSTYKESSQVSRLRSCSLALEDTHEDLQHVWQLCTEAKELTLGAFDPWAAIGGFDPSGIVKGWAAHCAADLLVADGAVHVLINAAGDLVLRGGDLGDDGAVRPWPVGISNPEDVDQIVKSFAVTDGAVATSGDYERGEHIRDPRNGMAALGAKSVTVVGPDGGLADALATAVMVDGIDAQAWVVREELREYSFYVINRHDGNAWLYGPNKGY
jgi:thiamine biosynthesis lipoprotein